MKLELGAGYQRTPGFTTVDINPYCKPDIIADVRYIPLRDGIATEIRAVDIWEHLPYRDTLYALKEWARLLAPDGRIYLQVPAADVAIERYYEQGARAVNDWGARIADPTFPGWSPISYLAWVLLGGQDDGDMVRVGDDPCWNLHMALFDGYLIRRCCHETGLEVVSLETNDHPNYCVWAVKP